MAPAQSSSKDARSEGHVDSNGASKPFSLSFGVSKPPTTTSKPVIPSKRPHAAALAGDSDQEDDDESRPQAVSGFGASGAIRADVSESDQQPKQPLVIPVQKDADWRDPGKYRRGRKGKDLLPPEARAARDQGRDDEQADKEEQKQEYGLLISQRKVEELEVDDMEVNGADAEPQPRKTLDEEALSRLISGDEKRSTLVIPEVTGDPNDEQTWNRRTELDGFQADVASRPEMGTVADYEAVPIEEFGAAMLRGMGWKDGGGIGRSAQKVKPKILERRPNLLGVGAKHAPEGLEEIGAWGKGAKDVKNVKKRQEAAMKGPRTREAYNPVVLKNSKTGEVLTEEEYNARQKKKAEREAEAAAREEDEDSARDARERRDRRDRKDRDHGRRRRDDYSDDDSHYRRRKDDRHRHSHGDGDGDREKRTRLRDDDEDDDRDRRRQRHRGDGDDEDYRDRRRHEDGRSRHDRDDRRRREDDKHGNRERRRDRDDRDSYRDSRKRSRSPRRRRSRSRDHETSKRPRYDDDQNGDRDRYSEKRHERRRDRHD